MDLDPAKLSAPAHLPDGGIIYPATWTPAECEAYAELVANLAQEAARAAALQAPAATGAAAVLEAKRAELEQQREANAERERQATDEAAWRDAVKKHGRKKVRRIPTVRGLVVMRTMTEKEAEQLERRAMAPGLSDKDGVELHKDFAVKCVEYPSPDQARAIATEFPLLWGTLIRTRDELAKGLAEDLGKGE